MKLKLYSFDSLASIKQRIYGFANLFDWAQVLDSNESNAALDIQHYELLAGIGLKQLYQGDCQQQLTQLNASTNWSFFTLPYTMFEQTDAPIIFEPQVVCAILKTSNKLELINNGLSELEFDAVVQQWEAFEFSPFKQEFPKLRFTANTSEQTYLSTVKAIQNDIYNGAYYELNYCIGFETIIKEWHSLAYFTQFNQTTNSPFAAWFKSPILDILCSSPERFLSLTNKELCAQPIKGTNRKLADNLNQLSALLNSEKDRAENVMIVDLMRNDLTKVSDYGSIQVKELCGAYAYTTVNHLVSTIVANQKEGVTFLDLMQACFPMGSMTGAPKLEVMKHIKTYEAAPRAYYSGSMGYRTPDGDFDANVLIRSLIYEPKLNVLTYKVGGAIVLDSEAELEYQECLLKGERMAQLFNA
jgi:para-aminobenzoate synthetase component 1